MGATQLETKQAHNEISRRKLTLSEKIGESALSTVFRAREHRSGEDVAIKVAPPGDTGAAARLLREHEVLRLIEHPNVVRASGIARLRDGSYGLVVDYVCGRSLLERVQDEGPMSVAGAAEVLTRVADGLMAVHSAGWLHSDVKPSNILLREDGTPILIDFGAARLIDGWAGFSGTLSFSSPEQIRGEAMDERSDVYSFGATAYFLLTGRPPYLPEVLYFHPGEVTGPPRLAQTTGLPFPQDLERAIASMVSVDREDRPRSMRVARALIDALKPATLGFDSSSFEVEAVEEEPTAPYPAVMANGSPTS